MKINFKNPKFFTEIFQQNKISFAIFEKKYYTLHMLNYWALCRDFLGDMLIEYYTKNKIEVYHFEFDNIKNINNIYIGIQLDTTLSYNNFIKNLYIINDIEFKNKFKPTNIYYQDHNFIIISFDKKWTKKAWLFSLYTFLLKAIIISDNFNTLIGREEHYFNETKHILYYILNNIKSYITKKTSYSGVKNDFSTIIHNEHGFVSQITRPYLENFSILNEQHPSL